MNWNVVLQILAVVIPSGGLIALLSWIESRRARQAETDKVSHEAYRDMYNDLSQTLIDLQKENERLYRAVRDLNRTIQKAVTCPHYADCPIRDSLQDRETDIRPSRRKPAPRSSDTGCPQGSGDAEPDASDD